MRIVIFVHCFFPDHFYGTESYTLDLAKNLRDFGHEPIVISAIFPGEEKRQELVTHYEYDGIPVFAVDKNYMPHSRIKDTYYQPSTRAVLLNLLTEIQPDIVHVTHLINHTATLLEVTHELAIPVIATFTDFYGFCFNNKLEAANGSLCRGPNQMRTNCLACVLKARSSFPNASVVEQYIGKYPISRVVAFGIKNLIHLPGLQRGQMAGFVLDITSRPDLLLHYYHYYSAVIAPTNFLRKAYHLNGFNLPFYDIKFGVDIPRKPKTPRSENAPIRFGFIGQLAYHKGVDILLGAFSQLETSNAELYLFGSESQDPTYSARLRQMAQGYAVKFCGTFPREKISDILDALDFLVIPSRWYENSPLVLLNSLASKTPVIVSDVEGMTEFIEPRKNGFTFQMGSTDSLKHVLQRIILEPDVSLQMTATTEYSRTNKTMVQEVVTIYENIMKKRDL